MNSMLIKRPDFQCNLWKTVEVACSKDCATHKPINHNSEFLYTLFRLNLQGYSKTTAEQIRYYQCLLQENLIKQQKYKVYIILPFKQMTKSLFYCNLFIFKHDLQVLNTDFKKFILYTLKFMQHSNCS